MPNKREYMKIGCYNKSANNPKKKVGGECVVIVVMIPAELGEKRTEFCARSTIDFVVFERNDDCISSCCESS